MVCKTTSRTTELKPSNKHPGSKIRINKSTQKCSPYEDDLKEDYSEEETIEEDKVITVKEKETIITEPAEEDYNDEEQQDLLLIKPEDNTINETLERWKVLSGINRNICSNKE